MNDVGVLIGKIVLGLLMLVSLAVIFAFPTMWLWNWLMPVIFKLTEINLWQALGINILSGLLFRSTNTVKSDNS